MRFLDIINELLTGDKDELARALKAACKDSALLPAFYKKFIESDVYALVYENDMKEGEQTLGEHSSVKLIRMNDKKVPVFSSRARIFDNGLVKKDGIAFISVKGTEFLNITKGETLIVNPFSKFSKELPPEETEGMLSGENLK
ncbi:MAG: SseB family protein [Endomicrobia bacterium]|nr:SseB family protein [Endomicrobiia bacterium]